MSCDCIPFLCIAYKENLCFIITGGHIFICIVDINTFGCDLNKIRNSDFLFRYWEMSLYGRASIYCCSSSKLDQLLHYSMHLTNYNLFMLLTIPFTEFFFSSLNSQLCFPCNFCMCIDDGECNLKPSKFSPSHKVVLLAKS